MAEQFFTDNRMFFALALIFLALASIGGVLVRWRDWDVLWLLAAELILLVFLVYYFQLWRVGQSPVTFFPEINLLVRPGIVSTWFLILVYSIVRLCLKYRVRHVL